MLARTWGTEGQELCPPEMHAYMRVIATPMRLPVKLRVRMHADADVHMRAMDVCACMYSMR